MRTDNKKPKPMDKARKPTGEMKMFLDIWFDRVSPDGKHRSEISGEVLDGYWGTDLFPNLFAHVLPKGAYPEHRLNADNCLLVSPVEHTLIDAGTEKQRQKYEAEHNCSFDIFYNKKEQLKQQVYGHTSF